MGTRGGGIDPGVLLHLNRRVGTDVEQIDWLLNRGSGLKGLCGVNDFRELCAQTDAGSPSAKLAFTAGVGENAANVREDSLSGPTGYGIVVDRERNRSSVRGARVISTDDSKTAVAVVPTNEELAIARAA